MLPLTIDITNWKKQFLIGLLIPALHPLGYLLIDVFEGKPIGRSISKFLFVYLFVLLIDVLFAVRLLFSRRIHKIVADDAGLHLKSIRSSRYLAWNQVATLERTIQVEGRTSMNCLILRDAGGQILAQIPRAVVEPAPLRAQFEQLEGLIISKIGARGVRSSALETQMPPNGFVLQTRNKIIGLGSLIFWIPATILSWNAKTGGPATGAIFLLFALLGIALALSDSRYEIDERGVRSRNLLETRELRWEEIQRAEMMRGNSHLYFSGGLKMVSMPGPLSWGKDAAPLTLFLQRQCEKFGVEWNGDKTVKMRELFLPRQPR